MVDAKITVLEDELLTAKTLTARSSEKNLVQD